MFDIINVKRLFFTTLMILTLGEIKCQEANNHLKLIVGGGYGHYFNNLTNVSSIDMVANNPNLTTKLMWQAEHRLRVGIESGYYPIYTTSRIQTEYSSIELKTHLNVIPILLNISMVLFKNVEASFSTGWASMRYSILSDNASEGSISGTTMSKYNLMLGLTYYYPISKRIDLGTEIKYLYLSKTLDNHMSISISLSYKFLSWK